MQLNWTVMEDGLGQQSVDRGTTLSVTPPPTSPVLDVYTFGFNSRSGANGAVAFRYNEVLGEVHGKGMRITGAIQRAISSGALGYSPFFFVNCQGVSVNDSAYILGLSNQEPYRIVLVKGKLSDGAPASTAETVLRASSATFALDDWLHLRLDAILNENGDVILDVFQNDLTTDTLTSPVWQSIAGMDQFVDDTLGISSGSPPLETGQVGFGFMSLEPARRSFFAHILIDKQTP